MAVDANVSSINGNFVKFVLSEENYFKCFVVFEVKLAVSLLQAPFSADVGISDHCAFIESYARVKNNIVKFVDVWSAEKIDSTSKNGVFEILRKYQKKGGSKCINFDTF